MIQRNKNKGFSLIELSIAIMASGILIVGATTAYMTYYHGKKYQNTLDSMDLVSAALSEFLARRGRYPCPAPLTAGPGDAEFGKEDCAGSITTTGRDADGNGTGDPIYIGAIPFETLVNPDNDGMTMDGIFSVSLPENQTVDGWRRKITYAVTASQTDTATFAENRGAISFVDEFGVSILDPADSAHVVLVSHGPNGVGAYHREGGIVAPCPATAAFNELENCDNDNLFVGGIHNETPGQYYDDVADFFLTRNQNLWRYISNSRVINTNPGNVGVGVNDPQQRLHVAGDIRAKKVYAYKFCDTIGDEELCMPPEVIGGEDIDMVCKKPGEAVTSIEDNKVVCEEIFSSQVIGTCPAGEFAVGFSTISGIICEAP